MAKSSLQSFFEEDRPAKTNGVVALQDNAAQSAFPVLLHLLKRSFRKHPSKSVLILFEKDPISVLQNVVPPPASSDSLPKGPPISIIDTTSYFAGLCEEGMKHAQALGDAQSKLVDKWEVLNVKDPRRVEEKVVGELRRLASQPDSNSQSSKESLDVFIDSLTSYASRTSTSDAFRLLRTILGTTFEGAGTAHTNIRITFIHHTDSPSQPHDSNSPSLTSLLTSPMLTNPISSVSSSSSPTKTSNLPASLIVLTLHPSKLIEHISRDYGIPFTQSPTPSPSSSSSSSSFDPITFELVKSLHRRAWGSPFSATVLRDLNSAIKSSGIGGGSFLSSSGVESEGEAGKDELEMMANSLSNLSTDTVGGGRCVVEYYARGVSLQNPEEKASSTIEPGRGKVIKGSSAGKPTGAGMSGSNKMQVQRGLEGLLMEALDQRGRVKGGEQWELRFAELDEVLDRKAMERKGWSGRRSEEEVGRLQQQQPQKRDIPSDQSESNANVRTQPTGLSNLPFNLGLELTQAQKEARDRVKSPFEAMRANPTIYDGPENNPYAVKGNGGGGQILYEPDSADDLDEEDPDEDLDI